MRGSYAEVKPENLLGDIAELPLTRTSGNLDGSRMIVLVILFTSLKLVRLNRLKASKMNSSPSGLSPLNLTCRPTLRSVVKKSGPRNVLRPTASGRSLLTESRLTSNPVRMLKGKPLRAVKIGET